MVESSFASSGVASACRAWGAARGCAPLREVPHQKAATFNHGITVRGPAHLHPLVHVRRAHGGRLCFGMPRAQNTARQGSKRSSNGHCFRGLGSHAPGATERARGHKEIQGT